jgi:hypothetical protein
MNQMWNRLRDVLARLWTSSRRRRSAAAVKTKCEGESGRSVDARARFWAEFREGQREAEIERSRVR